MGKRTLNRLSAKEVEKLKTPGRHSDGGGLYLAIDNGGRRRWVFKPDRFAIQFTGMAAYERDATKLWRLENWRCLMLFGFNLEIGAHCEVL